MIQLGIDIGGTFTDLIIVNDVTGDFVVNKTLSSPRDPSQAIEVALTEALLPGNIALNELATIVHGTTLVTNALIERKGDPAALQLNRSKAAASAQVKSVRDNSDLIFPIARA